MLPIVTTLVNFPEQMITSSHAEETKQNQWEISAKSQDYPTQNFNKGGLCLTQFDNPDTTSASFEIRCTSFSSKIRCLLKLLWKEGNQKKRPGLIVPQTRISYSERDWTPESLKPCHTANEQQKMQIFLPRSWAAPFFFLLCFSSDLLWVCFSVTSRPDKFFQNLFFPLQAPQKAVSFPSKLSQRVCEISLAFLEHATIGCCLSTNGRH